MTGDDAPALYSEARYYDIAFGWNLHDEAEFLVRCLKFHGVGRGLQRVLEPACGTGRMLVQMAQRGLNAHGYDIAEPAVAFAARRLGERGLSEHGTVAVADMRQPHGGGPFDGAFNLLNGLSYLTDDGSLIAHLRDLGANMSPGAAYIVQITLTDPSHADYEPQVWTRQSGDVEVTLTWGRERQDFAAKVNHDFSRLEVMHAGDHKIYEDQHEHRMWSYDDLQRLLAESGCFELTAIYDGAQKPVKLDSPDLATLHIPYFVLKRAA